MSREDMIHKVVEASYDRGKAERNEEKVTDGGLYPGTGDSMILKPFTFGLLIT